MTEKQRVAGTIMTHNPEGKYVFLVENENEKLSFPVTQILDTQTGLACILEELKQKLAIDIHNLNLFELTNAVVNGKNIPLFVFEVANKEIQVDDILKEDLLQLSFVQSGALTEALEGWEISGVPQF
ncbi:hypothetical protein [Carnobacterium funditum]|uniref:hypothetical protein n=1 Tax=Carnobacterium funditum TaxID=2752 RepID=UPI00055093E6|nr:hypothetical protein [Carnobacterium funditum]